ncbi:imidazolonepropionase [Aneurinibacillus sp. Ricciae_BoGa-3]|uniref:imidazolonepropionase n=1 Tax=Aneurinibacillus sp. Ricciae_BoGa-3 TaxID=3022697 RepID=UPI0023400781|nr:imidazolonepropionase [Aneurinibacillus sp. Ricciae_BoGa-3]WCK54542.1 imidazolonepropionase [Aneurinibacillus sp. Ricciae_BoGa-3]
MTAGIPLFIRHASQLVTLASGSQQPVTGRQMSELSIIEDGAVWVEDGLIQAVGTDSELARRYHERLGEAEILDASGKIVTPGLVDPHTHLVYAGSREIEFEMRLNGKTYMEIMRAGGGIHSTTRATRAASEKELIQQATTRLDSLLKHGVTTVEAKSGYGLTLESELKQLRAAHKLNEKHPVDIVSTFMGAHAIPEEYKTNPDDFVQIIVSEMIPEVARSGLASFNDVFCEKGVFTPEQAKKILRAGLSYGLLPKIHADEIEPYQGAELAAELKAVSADHLLRASDSGIQQMAASGVVAVLLPGTAFFLMTEPANGRKMIEAGCPVALATDCNPGSSPTVSMPLMMNLACLTMGMSLSEVLTASTINAAHALKMADRIGSIEPEKQADLVMFDAPNYAFLQYHYGVNLVNTVVKNGRIVIKKGVAMYDVSLSAS